jgi:hypothetical protein
MITGKARQDLEYEKFETDSSGNVAVNVVVRDALPISFTGSVSVALDSASDSVTVYPGDIFPVSDSSVLGQLQILNSLIPGIYDYIELGYNGSNVLTSSTFRNGGISGTVVSTLDLGYDGNGNLVSVAKS